MKKIMFNDKCGLTEAVLEGRKTQTRRVINLKDGEYVLVAKLYGGECMSYVAKDGKPTAHVGSLELPNFVRPLAPKYFIGEVVAVAQSYSNVSAYYAMNGELDKFKFPLSQGLTNKMFVKAKLMPHHIRILNISVERLQDISDENCLKEGIRRTKFGDSISYYFERGKNFYSVRDAYATLIDKVSGKGTWESNPYVFIYDFVKVD